MTLLLWHRPSKTALFVKVAFFNPYNFMIFNPPTTFEKSRVKLSGSSQFELELNANNSLVASNNPSRFVLINIGSG